MTVTPYLLGTPQGSAQGSSGTTTFTIAYPATVKSGDFLTLDVSFAGGTISTPSGWTIILGRNQAGATSNYTFYKFASGTEGGTTFTVTLPATGRAYALIKRWASVDATTPIDVAASFGQNVGTAGSTTCTISSLTTVTAGCRLVSTCVVDAATSIVWTPPPGWGELFTSNSGDGANAGKGYASADLIQVSAGATGTQAWNQGTAALRMDGIMYALRPGTGPAPSTSGSGFFA